MTRFGVSFVDKNGPRVLLGPAQARHLWDNRAEAEGWLNACFHNTGEDVLVQACGEQARGTFRVDPFDCYANGDPVGCYVKDEGSR